MKRGIQIFNRLPNCTRSDGKEGVCFYFFEKFAIFQKIKTNLFRNFTRFTYND
jgi:hypothetical protein